MYRVQCLFVKEHPEDEWKHFVTGEDEGYGNYQFHIELKRALMNYKYVREELERKDSVKTFVWEFTDGVLTKEPCRGDAPCDASPFKTKPNRKKRKWKRGGETPDV